MSKLLKKKQLQPSLIYESAETSYVQYVYSGNFITDIITWTSNLMTQKVQEVNYSYTSNRVTTITSKQYDRLGTLIETLTETLTYSGNNISTTSKVLT